MTISRAQMRRQLYYNGGIASLEPRQQYGLGSIVKSVTKAVKKVASSPVGQAALLYAGAAGLGALGTGTGWSGFTSSLFSPATVAKNLALSGKGFLTGISGGALQFPGAAVASNAPGAFKLGSLLTGKTGVGAAILGGSSLLTSLFGSPDQAQEAFNRDPGYVKSALGKYYRNLNPKKEGQSDEEYESDVSNFVNQNIAEFGDVSRSDVVSGYESTYGGRMNAAQGGIMNIPMGQPRMNQGGIPELDYRQEGGFVPVGIKEKADDVPAMLSKNEFVFTADAVKGADPTGEGNVERGAQALYNNMKRLESRIV